MTAPASNDDPFNVSLAHAAGFAFATIDSMLQLKEALLPAGIDIV